MQGIKRITGGVLGMLSVWAAADPMDLLQIYHVALTNNSTYQAAYETYQAQEDQIGISRAALLPQLTMAATYTYNNNESENGNTTSRVLNPTLTLTQQVINVADWRTYSEAEANAELAAVTYATALQSLIYEVSTQYFTVLNDQAQLRYDHENALAEERTLEQTEAQYKVGLNAEKDVLSAKAAYESAVAQVSSDQALMENDLETLNSYTGTVIQSIADIQPNFPLIKPSPSDPELWANRAQIMNLAVQAQKMQAKVNALGVQVAAAGFLPTASLSLEGSKSFVSSDNSRREDNSAWIGSVTGTYNIFSSGATVFSVASAEDTYQSAALSLVQTERNAKSSVTQDYLSVLSDLDQIDAYHQAVIAAQSAVDATFAGYKVGTETIVDLLKQQATLFQSQSNYAKATFSYIKDSITLKRDTGVLTEQDVVALNSWLVSSK